MILKGFVAVLLTIITVGTAKRHETEESAHHQTLPEFEEFKQRVCRKVPKIVETVPTESPPIETRHSSAGEGPSWPLDQGGSYFGAPESAHAANYMELAFINMVYGFSTDNFMTFLPQNGIMKLVQRLVNTMATMTKYTCGLNVLPPEYINSAKNLFLWYFLRENLGESFSTPDNDRHDFETSPNEPEQPRRSKRSSDDGSDARPIHDVPFFANGFIFTPYGNTKNLSRLTIDNREWNETLTKLEVCLDSVARKPMNEFILRTTCGRVTSYSTAWNATEVPLQPPYERADLVYYQSNVTYGEEVLEAIWWMFSLTFGRCYEHAYPREAWVLAFKEKFMKDVFAKFIPRWQYPGLLTSSFGLVFGNYDVRIARRNLRYCAHAAYVFEDMERRALVRPWRVRTTDHGDETIENYKMGKPLYYSPLL